MSGQLAFSFPSGRIGESYDPQLDEERLTNNTLRVLRLLLDGEPHTVEELRAVGGLQGDRRARDLRSDRLGAFDVQAFRDPHAPPGSGRWLYRLMNPTAGQVAQCLKACGVEAGDDAAR